MIRYGANKGAMRGRLNAVGGHIEQGEDIIRAADREIFEETGLTCNNTRLRGVVHVSEFFATNVMMFVTVSQANTEVVQCSEEGALEWISESDIISNPESLNVFADITPILAHIHEASSEQPFFTATSKFDGKGTLLQMEFH